MISPGRNDAKNRFYISPPRAHTHAQNNTHTTFTLYAIPRQTYYYQQLRMINNSITHTFQYTTPLISIDYI